jgi:hypothetical protein
MRSLISFIVAAVTAIPVHAQEKIESTEISFYVQTSGGNLAVCGADAVLIYRDQTYRRGAVAGIRASLRWVEDKGNIGLLLKAAGVDFPNADKKDITPKLFRVDHSFVAVDGKPFAPDNSSRCEEPAAFCGWYWLPASAVIAAALPPGKLAIGFNREANGLDISLPIDPADSVRSKPDEYRTFAACMSTLVDRAKTKLPK